MKRRNFLKALGITLLAPLLTLIPKREIESVDSELDVESFDEDGVTFSTRPGYTTYYVRADGCDSNCGTACNQCLRTVQRACDLAQPGDVIEIVGTHGPFSVTGGKYDLTIRGGIIRDV